LNGVTINNQAGMLQANGVGSAVVLDNATIVGGALVQNVPLEFIDPPGFLTVVGSQSNVLDGTRSAVTNDAFARVDADSSVTLKGEITNEGGIELYQGDASLKISGNVRLDGGGFVLMTTGTDSITAAGPGGVLTNVNNEILGNGTVGNSQMTLINDSLIEADPGDTLILDTGSNAITNSGTLNSIGVGTSFPSDLIVKSAVVGTGTDTIAWGTTEFGSSVSSGQTVDFTNAPTSGPAALTGKLQLDHAESFSGTIEGLATFSSSIFDTIDLKDFKSADTQISAVSGTGRAGTTTNVTLTDSSDHLTETLHLLNQYTNQFAVNRNDYSLTSDGASPAAGTLFSVDHSLGVPNHGTG
jgi:hypothetical protein